MLKKLLKHEFHATARIFIPAYIALLIFSVLTTLVGMIDTKNVILKLVLDIIFYAYIICAIFLILGAITMAVVRFYKNLLTTEGYLSFTLPVKVKSLIAAKVIPGVTWIVLTIILCLASVCTVLHLGYDINVVKVVTAELTKAGINSPAVITLIALFIIVTMFYQLSTYFLSLSCGQMLKNKIIGSIIFYFIIYMAIEVILVVFILAGSAFIDLETLERWLSTKTGITTLFSIISGFEIIVGCVELHLTNKMLSKRLNL